jgi:hypothetical protein
MNHIYLNKLLIKMMIIAQTFSHISPKKYTNQLKQKNYTKKTKMHTEVIMS